MTNPARNTQKAQTQTQRRFMSDTFKFKIWEWAEWITKAILVAICGLLWQMNLDVSRSLQQLNNQSNQISELKSEVSAIKQGYMSRIEVLETIKRVEMNQEKMILQYEVAALKRGAK